MEKSNLSLQSAREILADAAAKARSTGEVVAELAAEAIAVVLGELNARDLAETDLGELRIAFQAGCMSERFDPAGNEGEREARFQEFIGNLRHHRERQRPEWLLPEELDVCICGRSRGAGVHAAGALNGHAFEAAAGPRHPLGRCTSCGVDLLFSARARGDGLCGPCSRRAAGTDTPADRARRKRKPA